MSDNKSNQTKKLDYGIWAIDPREPYLHDVNEGLLMEYAKYDPYLVRLCSKCGMEESACICSQYDSEGNEL